MRNRPQNLIQLLRGMIRAWSSATLPSSWNSLLGVGLMSALLAQAGGCGSLGGEKITPPAVNTQLAADKAIEQYDQNGDSVLDKTELEGCPGMLRAFSAYDANEDGDVDGAELKSHFDTLYGSDVGLMSAGCSITRSGQPVAGAIVRFIPEAFLGEAIHAAEGITDRSGYARIAVPDQELPASHHGLNMAHVGIYRVEVETSPGEIAEPKRSLGTELNPTARQSTNPTFDLAR